MNKFAVVIGVAAVATLAGCKDPKYAGNSASVQDEPKEVAATTPEAAPVAETPAPAEKRCTCAPGTKHTEPCNCGAADCQCVVVAKPVPPPEPEYTIYIVQHGDYLAKIARKYSVAVSSIKSLNGMKDDMIRIGQKLKLPGKIEVGEQKAPVEKPAAKAAPAVKAYTGATKEYVVKNGDTLGAIALAGGISVRQLRQLNNLQSDALKIGQKLKVPAEKQVKAAKADKKAAAPVAKPAEAVKPAEAPKPAEVAPAPAPVSEPVVEKPVEAAPAEPVVEAPAQAAATQLNTYTVQEGDDITGVSIRWGVTASAIRDLNNLPEDAQLKPGQVLKLPADAQQ